MKIFRALLFALLTTFASLGLSAQSGKNWDPLLDPDSIHPSMTIPVLHIDTENGQVIDRKETYIPAKAYFTNLPEGMKELGSQVSPMTLGIKGRGNSTWLMDKKPYKLKFDKKQEILGMPKSKHWVCELLWVGISDIILTMQAL